MRARVSLLGGASEGEGRKLLCSRVTHHAPESTEREHVGCYDGLIYRGVDCSARANRRAASVSSHGSARVKEVQLKGTGLLTHLGDRLGSSGSLLGSVGHGKGAETRS